MSKQLLATIPQDELKAQAKRLRSHLATMGFELKHTQALHAVAAQWGFKNWQTVEALQKSVEPFSHADDRRGRASFAAPSGGSRNPGDLVSSEDLGFLQSRLHRLHETEELLDQRMEESRIQALEARLSHPFNHQGLRAILQIAVRKDELVLSIDPWIDIADSVASLIAQFFTSEGDVSDANDKYLLLIADLLVEQRFLQMVDRLMGLPAYALALPFSRTQVDAVLQSGFFGPTSERMRTTFCFYFGIDLPGGNRPSR